MSTSQFGTIFELGAARLLDLGHQSQLLAHSFGLIDRSLVGLNPDLVCIDVHGRCSSEGERVPVRTCRNDCLRVTFLPSRSVLCAPRSPQDSSLSSWTGSSEIQSAAKHHVRVLSDCNNSLVGNGPGRVNLLCITARITGDHACVMLLDCCCCCIPRKSRRYQISQKLMF